MEEKHDEEFWKKIIQLAKDGNRISMLAKQYNFSNVSYYYWKNKLSDPTDNENDELSDSDIKELRKENLRLKQENEILKKAISIIGKN